ASIIKPEMDKRRLPEWKNPDDTRTAITLDQTTNDTANSDDRYVSLTISGETNIKTWRALEWRSVVSAVILGHTKTNPTVLRSMWQWPDSTFTVRVDTEAGRWFFA
ncbi:hypothetical protein, partial [Asaia bogorensis]|uniref:hypothetical protein n=1 Tax=Asaia bogorensis TaxID=91915 RepID=UPI0022315497